MREEIVERCVWGGEIVGRCVREEIVGQCVWEEIVGRCVWGR